MHKLSSQVIGAHFESVIKYITPKITIKELKM